MELIRFLQSKQSSFFRRSSPWGPIRLNRSSMSPRNLSQSLLFSQPGSSDHPGMLSSVGFPMSLKILTHWSTSDRPSRMGLRSNISPKMQLDDDVSVLIAVSQKRKFTQRPTCQ